jgi:hypothetical protein
MRIIITESQYKSILNENRFDSLVDKVIDEYKDEGIEDVINVLFKRYGLDLKIIRSNQKLNDFFNSKFGELINDAEKGYVSKWSLGRSYGDETLELIVSIFEEYLSSEIQQTYDIKNPISQLKRLSTLKKVGVNIMGGGSDVGEYMDDVMEGMINDCIDYIYSNYSTIKDMLKQLAVVKKQFSNKSYGSEQIDKQFRSIGKKYGYTMIPKHLEWSFEKGGGRIQQVIDYIKDKPKQPLKTKRGWMEYIGVPYAHGWNARLWRTLNNTGIIKKTRVGNTFTYDLGPNAEAFEQGKLVGY